MRLKRVIGVSALLAATVSASAVIAHSPAEIKSKVMGHLGGTATWNQARFAHFVYAVERDKKVQNRREHYWDRYEGRYVLKTVDKEGRNLRIYFNVNTKKGVAMRDGVALEGAENDEWVEKAYRIYINDTYWLFMPTKLKDPGVTLTFFGHGDEDIHGNKTDLAQLTFEPGTGLTPGDVYDLTLAGDGEILKWKYTLEDGTEGEWLFQELKDCGMGLRFHTRKYSVERRVAIVFPVVELSKYMDEKLFDPR